MKRENRSLTFLVAAACVVGVFAVCQPAVGQTNTGNYHFDGSISREVLENYLSRSVSFTELLHDDLTSTNRNRYGVDPHDNLRFILNTKAKFVGRALMCWGRERELDTLLHNATYFASELHKADPNIVLQGAAFEIVTRGVETVAIPPYVFQAFGQPVTNRNFVFADIGYATGNHRMGSGNVPDMSQLEARMWFYYLCTKYIDAGIEGIHFGQVGLMDQNDRHHVGWLDMLGKVRAYAHEHARRHFIICDAHTPKGGFVEDGHLLFDAHAFPLRISEVPDQPIKGFLEVGHLDSLVTKSMGGITPSGWSCDHLPYLVEFDNFGGRNQGNSTKGTIFIWGYDEITWFSALPEADRNAWLHYAWDWLKQTDPNGHLEMPGSRTITPARGGRGGGMAGGGAPAGGGAAGGGAAVAGGTNGISAAGGAGSSGVGSAAAGGAPAGGGRGPGGGRGAGGGRWFNANTKSDACPTGSNTEETIKEIWASDHGT